MKKRMHLFPLVILILCLSGCYTDFETLFGKKDLHNGMSDAQTSTTISSQPQCESMNMNVKEESGVSAPDDLSQFVRGIQVVESEHTLQFTFSKWLDGNFPNIIKINFQMVKDNTSPPEQKEGVCLKSNGPDPDTEIFSCKVAGKFGDKPDWYWALNSVDVENEKTHGHAVFQATCPAGTTTDSQSLSVYMANTNVPFIYLSDPKTELDL